MYITLWKKSYQTEEVRLVKSRPYRKRSTSNFVENFRKLGHSILIIALNIWNYFSNFIRNIPLWASFKNILKQCF